MEPRNQNSITYFAQTNYRGEARKFGIKRDDRRRHMYVIGKTGMGKSTMLENMIIQDIQNGEGLAVVDPHGDLVEKVINYIPKERLDDVIYFNPADLNFPIAFNIVEEVDDEYKNLIANGLVGVFKKIWADSWGPRLEYILTNTILSLLDYPGATLLDVTRVLVDATYRKKVVKKIKDPIVRSFWINEYNNYTEKFRNEAIAPIQNKVGQFLSSSLIRNIVGQEKSTIDVRKEMDEGKILLMNLSKGRIGEENAALLGAMMITKIQLAAMSRVDIPEEERRDFFLYVDEFQNFSTESFASILSEARKYRLNITMAHQYIEQLSDEVKAAVFGNVGSMVAFRVGATDAEELEKEFQPTFMQEDVVKLPSFHIYLRLMIDGVASDPFSATTLQPISDPDGLREEVIDASRAKYSSDRFDVEHAIELWAAVDENQVTKLNEIMEKKLQRDRDDVQAAEEAKRPKTVGGQGGAVRPRSKNGIPLPVETPEASAMPIDIPVTASREQIATPTAPTPPPPPPSIPASKPEIITPRPKASAPAVKETKQVQEQKSVVHKESKPAERREAIPSELREPKEEVAQPQVLAGTLDIGEGAGKEVQVFSSVDFLSSFQKGDAKAAGEEVTKQKDAPQQPRSTNVAPNALRPAVTVAAQAGTSPRAPQQQTQAQTPAPVAGSAERDAQGGESSATPGKRKRKRRRKRKSSGSNGEAGGQTPHAPGQAGDDRHREPNNNSQREGERGQQRSTEERGPEAHVGSSQAPRERAELPVQEGTRQPFKEALMRLQQNAEKAAAEPEKTQQPTPQQKQGTKPTSPQALQPGQAISFD